MRNAVKPISRFLEQDVYKSRQCVSQIQAWERKIPRPDYPFLWNGWEVLVKVQDWGRKHQFPREGVPFLFRQDLYTRDDVDKIAPVLERLLERWPYRPETPGRFLNPNDSPTLKAIRNCCTEIALPKAPLIFPRLSTEEKWRKPWRIQARFSTISLATGQSTIINNLRIEPQMEVKTPPEIPSHWFHNDQGRWVPARPYQASSGPQTYQHDVAYKIIACFIGKFHTSIMGSSTCKVLFRHHLEEYGITGRRTDATILLTHFEEFVDLVDRNRESFIDGQRWTRPAFSKLIRDLRRQENALSFDEPSLRVLLDYCYEEHVFFRYYRERVEAVSSGWSKE